MLQLAGVFQWAGHLLQYMSAAFDHPPPLPPVLRKV